MTTQEYNEKIIIDRAENGYIIIIVDALGTPMSYVAATSDAALKIITKAIPELKSQQMMEDVEDDIPPPQELRAVKPIVKRTAKPVYDPI